MEPSLRNRFHSFGTSRNLVQGFGRLPQTTPKLYWKNPEPFRLLGNEKESVRLNRFLFTEIRVFLFPGPQINPKNIPNCKNVSNKRPRNVIFNFVQKFQTRYSLERQNPNKFLGESLCRTLSRTGGRKTCNPIQRPDHKPYGSDQELGWEFVGLSRTLSTLSGTVSMLGTMLLFQAPLSGKFGNHVGNPARHPTAVNPTIGNSFRFREPLLGTLFETVLAMWNLQPKHKVAKSNL